MAKIIKEDGQGRTLIHIQRDFFDVSIKLWRLRKETTEGRSIKI
jgi:hypothetical protein